MSLRQMPRVGFLVLTTTMMIEGLSLHQVPRHDAVQILKNVLGTHLGKIVYPGPNPCSIERADQAKFSKYSYFCAEKTDGMRMGLICCSYQNKKVTCLVNRKMELFYVQIKNMPRQNYQGVGSFYDGEVCLNKSDGQVVFLVFDCFSLNGIPIYNCQFSRRLHLARLALEVYHPDAADDLNVKLKHFLSVGESSQETILHHYETISESFGVDGLIFMPEELGIHCGRFAYCLKWKPLAQNTVDFKLGRKGELFVFDTNARKDVEVAQLADCHAYDPGDILECSWVDDEQRWSVKMVRKDKGTSNDLFTYKKTLLNIKEALDIIDVLTMAHKK